MTQAERRIFLIQQLLSEQPKYNGMTIPSGETEQKALLRSLINIRQPHAVTDEFLSVQDEYLQNALAQKRITELASLTPVMDGIYLWRGDITTLRCGAIVNAANRGMTGCYLPCHSCIDNCIHTYAGVQLRLACAEIIKKQRQEEATGTAKITPAYNLPCNYILHTVGPIIQGCLTQKDKALLASCYRSCLELAEQNSIKSIAFCCISTGEYHFPNNEAAEIAVKTVRDYLRQTHSAIEVIFNVYKDIDYQIYKNIFTAN